MTLIIRLLPLAFITLFTFQIASAQFGYGLTFTNDLYHRYTNPDETGNYASSGNAILNLALGPKIWVGGPKFSVSAEAQAGIGLTSLAVKNYKGLGTASFPMVVQLNFGGTSGFDKEGKTGLTIGGGLQYSKTELYGLSQKYIDKGVERKLFKTYIAQAGYGFGLSGFSAIGVIKYGWNPDNDAQVMSVGIQWDFNAPMLRKISNPSNEL